MSIARALGNALSGLTATARGTETVAANIANASTPGYARRDLAVSAQTAGGNAGGVRVDGVTRAVNASVLSESRLAEAARANAATRLDFATRIEEAVGIAGNTGSLGSALSDFRTALSSAASRPDDDIRLTQVVDKATALADRLNAASDEVQAARSAADQAIASDIATLNKSLAQVADLNRKIAVLEADGSDPSSLYDQRQGIIGEIAKIVPVQEVTRTAGAVALFTAEGAVLLDGTMPTELSFTAAGQVTADRTAGSGLSMLVQNGAELTQSQMKLYAGGSLAANFAIRDELAPAAQDLLDDIALDLHGRLANPAVDPTLTASSAGLFTDGDARASAADKTGLAGRISVNDAVVESAGGEAWRIRAGLGAATPGAVGDASLLVAMSDALDAATTATAGTGFSGKASLADRLGAVESRIATTRVNAQSEAAVINSQADTITSRLAADGVDSDAEMQKLLQYEQAYAANARVIQAIQTMMDQILEI
ncbi:flagellar hook-associated protein FlgK [Paracoccus benzoatiresistens]|uniref:Flagellar hook-associated protein 1 n=1 Tax=Paracoccus benzoatiresistens TaxID=2997341 RepID=A0ABT4J094_9RHOB|nr:flagellar hook-associated protein FlgK [Paracoccus sp. EF6]MCZ0960539.1 flagellar hook-associated protein FlgK [Paracoccus sp. EF6]